MNNRNDKIEDLISQEEIDQITKSYRKVAGFDVEALNRKGFT